MGKRKFYVVWVGVNPGIYTSWNKCQTQIEGYHGAKYKSFDSLEKAQEAFELGPETYFEYHNASIPSHKNSKQTYNPPVKENAVAVDAACSGNPGMMEYQGVHVASGQVLFHFGPMMGTNNIGEFLAIVHGLVYLKKNGYNMPLYSDSTNAILWVKQKQCKTTLKRTSQTEALFLIIQRAEQWLQNNTYSTPIIKWNTKEWGEIPADFGRK